MDPVSATAVQESVSRTAADQMLQTEFASSEQPDPADVARFEAAMQAAPTSEPPTQARVYDLSEVQATSGVQGTAPDSHTMGDLVLDTLQSVQDSQVDGMARIHELFRDGELTTAECMEVQMEFSRMHIEMELAGKSADKASSGVQQMMKQQ